jgi:hypothetical protein
MRIDVMKGIIPPAMIFTAVLVLAGGSLCAQSPYQTDADFAAYAMKLREAALLKMEPLVVVPLTSRTLRVSDRYPWKTGIVTTLFSVGGAKGSDKARAWDPKWQESFGGFDNPNPAKRRNFIPVAFVPRLNPFYIALPYNDVARGTTKPEAKVVIPWFREAFVQEGQTVCRDRWIAIRSSAGKVCYAQWSDCGPFRSDHWQYVFGNEKPKPNSNQGAGLNISPAVRDYLRLDGTDVTDWKFVDFKDVPKGPWSLYGENNHFVQQARRSSESVGHATPLPSRTPSSTQDAPVIISQ